MNSAPAALASWEVSEEHHGLKVPDQRTRYHPKVSSGLILCRRRGGHFEVLAVRGRYSYAFSDFVHGRYARRDLKVVRTLLAHMSLNERLDVMSLNFEQMWYRIWLTAKRTQAHYYKSLEKFQRVWLEPDNGKLLLELLREAPGLDEPRWEIPKGKPLHGGETSIVCAVREFSEETGIPRDAYRLLPDYSRQVSYIHMGVRYVITYHLAFLSRPLAEPGETVSLRRLGQAAEINEVRWMGMGQINWLDRSGAVPGSAKGRCNLGRILRPAFNYLKKYLNHRSS